jgi:hypothetical protein
MKFRYKLLIGLAALLCLLGAFSFLLHSVGNFRRDNDYAYEAKISSDNKSFYIKKTYDISEVLYSNNAENIKVEFQNFESSQSTGKTIAKVTMKDIVEDCLSVSAVKNGKLYYAYQSPVTNMNSKMEQEFRYYPGLGQPVVRKYSLTAFRSLNPANFIFLFKDGFYLYDPVTGTSKNLCNQPNVEKDAENWVKKYMPTFKMNSAKIHTKLIGIEPGNRTGNFWCAYEVFMPGLEKIVLCYYYDFKSGKLKNAFDITAQVSPLKFHRYETSDDRWILLVDKRYLVLDVDNSAVIQSKVFSSCNFFYHCPTQDLRYSAASSSGDISIIDEKTGSRRNVYKETRPDYSVRKVFWFPVENCLIAELSITTQTLSKPVYSSEIIAIDPFTGNIRQIVAPSPCYTQRNNEVFKTLCNLSDKVKPLSDRVDAFLTK